MKRNSTPKTVRRIRDVSKTVSKLDPVAVKQALGAQDAGVSIGHYSPVTMIQIRQEIARRLTSSGGRPALVGASQRVKIPLSDQQWSELERIANEISEPGCKTSPGQVASVIISLSLRGVGSEHRTSRSETTTRP